MHETLRKRVVRRLEALPEAQLYQALDYIEFLESRYGARAHADVSGLQTLAERLEDGLRKRAFSPGALREAFQLIDVADRVLGSVKEAGREILSELQAAPEPRPGGAPAQRRASTARRGPRRPGNGVKTVLLLPVDTPGGAE